MAIFNNSSLILNRCRRDLSNRIHEVANVNETISTYSRRNSNNSAISNANSEPFEIAAHHVKWVLIRRKSNTILMTSLSDKVCTWLVQVLVQADNYARRVDQLVEERTTGNFLGARLNNICEWVSMTCWWRFDWWLSCYLLLNFLNDNKTF